MVKNTLRLIEENKNNNIEVYYSYRGEDDTTNKRREIHEISGPAVIFYIVSLEEALKIVEWIDTTKVFVFKPPYETQDEDQDDLRGAMRE
ncbi:MAG: hypothetical protein RXP92_01715 [Candidatus Micrarchaeota archaeon]